VIIYVDLQMKRLAHSLNLIQWSTLPVWVAVVALATGNERGLSKCKLSLASEGGGGGGGNKGEGARRTKFGEQGVLGESMGSQDASDEEEYVASLNGPRAGYRADRPG
jgi:hypothetical protein